MKIIKFEAEHVKRIAVVEITPAGHVVEITGKNGQGKTSVLDSIWWALAGTRSHQPEPINRAPPRGADQARPGRVDRRAGVQASAPRPPAGSTSG